MPSHSGPDRSKDTPAKVASKSQGLDESLEGAVVARRELSVVLPPPAPIVQSVKHPYREGVTTETALDLARTLKYGPLPKPNDPTPTVNEAIELLQEERRTCGFNWATGTVAIEVLRMTRGEEVTVT